MKVNGEIGYKRYQRGKLLGKGISISMKVASPNAMKDSISKQKNIAQ
jgi:hypothetical protein